MCVSPSAGHADRADLPGERALRSMPTWTLVQGVRHRDTHALATTKGAFYDSSPRMASTTSEELPRLGRYQVINKIAAGGMAEVFLAKAVGAMGFQRLVAVKLIHANFTRDQEFVKMFIDEARIAMHLHHRNIVQVFDLDRANDTYFIAMEFVHGVNLYDVYERIASKGRWIEPSMALYLVAELSKGLHFAHTRKGPDGRPLGIVHRDISPQNILLSFEGEVKITDFGIATAAERLHQTAAGIVKGKYAYMAPERLQEQPTDGRVDVFSAGVLLYELLVGENPFAGASAVDTIENVLNKKIAPPSERGAPVSQQLDRITLKALARNPAERYATAQDLADALTEYALELTHARKDMAAGDGALAALLAELFPEKAKRPPGATNDPKSIHLPGLTGVRVQTVDGAAEPKPRSKSNNGRTNADLLRTQEENARSRPSFRDPADSDEFPEMPDPGAPTLGADANDLDEPTVLRLTPLSERADLLPKLSLTPPKTASKPAAAPKSRPRNLAQSDDDFPTREVPGVKSAASGFTTLPPYPIDDSESMNLDTDKALRGMETPITPVAEDAVDRTAPTELPPSMIPQMRKPIVSAVSTPTDPGSGDHPEIDDGYASTVPSRDGIQTISENDELGMPPPPVAPQPPVRAAFSPPSNPARPPVSSSARDQALIIQPVAPHPSESNPGGLPHPMTPQPGTYPPQHVQPFRGQRTTTIIAILLFIIAILVVFVAVLVVREREHAAPARSQAVTLKVQTNPTGAKVTVDGLEQQGVTPLSIQVLANEDHLIGVSLAGYLEPPVKKIRPPEGTTQPVNFDLVPLRGSISFQVTPPDAAIYINDQEKGVGNITVSDLPLGTEIVVRVEAKGYKTIEQKIVLEPESREMTMPLVLARGRSTAPLRAEARMRRVQLVLPFETWATIYWRNKWLGTTPATVTLPIGDVQLRVINEAQKLDKVITVTIPESGPDKITLNVH
jgi:eukaryotic-like serine/threonine-protein kinase